MTALPLSCGEIKKKNVWAQHFPQNCIYAKRRPAFASAPSDRSLTGALWVAEDPKCLKADSEDFDKS